MSGTLATHIEHTLKLPASIVAGYLEDLSDTDLLLRPHIRMNHIAWQLGHLISGENWHINQVVPDSMPELPDGFAAMHTKETVCDDNAANFLSKSEYLAEMERQREGTLNVLNRMSDEELMRPAPENVQYFGANVGAVFSGESTHWMMHAGQWAVVRRELGREPLF